MTGCITVYVTAGSRALAERIGLVLVEERLAACANVFDGVTSLYRWEGRVQRDQEVALLLKTRAELFPRVAARVQALHDYALPCIVAWAIEQAEPGYLRWVLEQTEGLDPAGPTDTNTAS